MDINTDQYLPGVIPVITDSQGRPAGVDGAPVWASSDANVLQIAQSADGMTVVVTPMNPGTAFITVSADADTAEGVRQISGRSEDIVVALGPSHVASAIAVDLGAPADKPVA